MEKPRVVHFKGEGVRLAGERWDGDGGLCAVVLLHGGGQTRHSWKRTAERLAGSDRTVVALDARGHGESDWHPGQDYSIDGFVGDLLEVVDTLGRAPVLVGASLGGITALNSIPRLTTTEPGCVNAVVINERRGRGVT